MSKMQTLGQMPPSILPARPFCQVTSHRGFRAGVRADDKREEGGAVGNRRPPRSPGHSGSAFTSVTRAVLHRLHQSRTRLSNPYREPSTRPGSRTNRSFFKRV